MRNNRGRGRAVVATVREHEMPQNRAQREDRERDETRRMEEMKEKEKRRREMKDFGQTTVVVVVKSPWAGETRRIVRGE